MNFDGFVLAASTADLADEPAAREHADVVEFRMDLADQPLAALEAYHGDLPILATNRAAWEGGAAEDDEERLEALEAALDVDAVAAIDLELAAVAEGAPTHDDSPADADAAPVADAARERGVSVVVSAHDFDATPPREDLVGTLERAASLGTVGKLAVTATDRGDVLALLDATHDLTESGERVATMAMGEAGRHSRAVAPVYGSAIGYAPVDPADATAPGQYDLATLATLVEDLGGSPSMN